MFDSVFDEKSSQDDIFQEAGKFVVENALKGYNGSIFVYGQTGSGKSKLIRSPSMNLLTDRMILAHTMQGDCNSEEYADNTDRGLMPRIFDYIFLSLEKQDEVRVLDVTQNFSNLSSGGPFNGFDEVLVLLS